MCIFAVFVQDHESMLTKCAKAIPDVTFDILSSPLSLAGEQVYFDVMPLKQGGYLEGYLAASAHFDPPPSSSDCRPRPADLS